MAKSTRKKAASQAAEKSPSRSSGGDRLLGAVWHNGKMYDPKSKADHEAFKKLVESENKLGDKNKDGSPRAKLDTQRLADEGVLVGFGAKASAKGKKAADRADDEEAGFEDTGDSPVGGGVDAVEEQELMEQEQEEEE